MASAVIEKKVSRKDIELEVKSKILLAIQENYKCTSCDSLPHPGLFPMYHCSNEKCPGGYSLNLKCSACFKEKRSCDAYFLCTCTEYKIKPCAANCGTINYYGNLNPCKPKGDHSEHKVFCSGN